MNLIDFFFFDSLLPVTVIVLVNIAFCYVIFKRVTLSLALKTFLSSLEILKFHKIWVYIYSCL